MQRILKISILLVMMLASAVSPAHAQLSEVSVGPGETQEIDRHGICKVVKNLNPTNALYVPSMSRDEWVNFLSVPPWRDVSECKACSGYSRDGYCFYGAAAYQTCNSVCSSKGGVNSVGMNRLIDRTLIGAADPASNLYGGQLILAGGVPGPSGRYYCHIVAEVLLGAPSTLEPTLQTTGAYGCTLAVYGTGPYLAIDNGWNGNAAYQIDQARQVCACNR